MSPGPSFTAPEPQAQSILKTQCSSDTKWVQGHTQVAMRSWAFLPQSSGSSPQDATWAPQQRQAQKGKSTRGMNTAAAGRGSGAAQLSGTGARPCWEGRSWNKGRQGWTWPGGDDRCLCPLLGGRPWTGGANDVLHRGPGVSGRGVQRPHDRQQHGPLMPGARGDGLGGPRTGRGPSPQRHS